MVRDLKRNLMSNKTQERFGLLAIALVLVWLVGYPVAYRASSESATLVVQDKFIKRSGAGEHAEDRYLVSTEDGRVFENTDSFVFFKWDSSNVYAKLRKGHRYRARTAGWRVPFFSMKENIISVEDLGVAAKATKSSSEVDGK